MRRNEDESIFAEEMELALINLAQLTRKGMVHWNCTNYNPLSLMPTDDNHYAYVCHILQAAADHNGHSFSLELTETIDIPSGRGNLSIVFAPDWIGKEPFYVSLSDYSEYRDCPTAELLTRFQSKPPVLIADAVFPQLESSQTVIDTKPHGQFLIELYPPYIAKCPFTVLSKLLHETGRLNDFHRCVLDMDYRDKLIEETKIR